MKLVNGAKAALSLALLLVTGWACDRIGDAVAPDLSPREAVHSDGTVPAQPYTIARGNVPHQVRTDAQVIQPAAGGDVGVAGNVLIVPKGATTAPTLFEMTLSPVEVDGTTKLKVDLRAYAQDAQGNYTVDVGARGFLKPLKLRLSYEYMVDKANENQLQVVWVKPDGSQELYPTTVDKSLKRIHTQLSHFSDYGVGFP